MCRDGRRRRRARCGSLTERWAPWRSRGLRLGLVSLFLSRNPNRGVPMPNVLYTAEAHVTGGRGQGHGRTSDGQLDVQLRLPKEMGGAGDGTNPEQLFAVGSAACFEGALGVAGRRAKVEV